MGCLFVYVRVFGDTLQDMNGNPLLFLYMPIGGCRRHKVIFMEIFWFFSFISSVVLSFIIANAGAKRQIGFGWSLFLGLWLTPIVSLIAVLLSDKLQPDEYGRIDKKWGCIVPFIISFLIIGTAAYAIYSFINRDKEKRGATIELSIPEVLKSDIIEEVEATVPIKNNRPIPQEEIIIAPEVLFDEPTNSAYESLTERNTDPANEIEIDLNDFLGMPDDGIDWNSTELSESDCEALARQKIYYSEKKGAWVMEKSRKEKEDAKIAERRRQEAEWQYATQATCRIVYELNGRQAKSISSIENAGSQEGFIYLKIEVSPNGDVVSCEIDPRSIIDDSNTRELCISSAKNIKFNAIDSKRNQSGIIKYIFTK
ncbi:hypothetical protein M105_1885 [Bacteroides fragilis str. 1009-4-F |nr:hypothetical protein M105_1885 [Bacteroides fragilis str. 1009-4-F \